MHPGLGSSLSYVCRLLMALFVQSQFPLWLLLLAGYCDCRMCRPVHCTALAFVFVCRPCVSVCNLDAIGCLSPVDCKAVQQTPRKRTPLSTQRQAPLLYPYTAPPITAPPDIANPFLKHMHLAGFRSVLGQDDRVQDGIHNLLT